MVARKLVSNAQGGPLSALQVSANQPMFQQSLGALVVHAVTALISRSSLDLLCPLVTLLKAPGSMAVSSTVGCHVCETFLLALFQNCYLPTMTEDMLPEARRIIAGGEFYGLGIENITHG